MADKPRTPPPPRPVQAPRRRDGRPARGGADPAADARTRRLLILFAASGVLGLVVVGALVFLLGRGGSSSSQSALEKAGCTLKTFPSLPPKHETSLTAKVKWNSFPPTSGPHYFQPAIWGSYNEPVKEIQAVHNLEHGGVVVQWGDKIPKGDVTAIQSWYQGSPNGLLAAPLPALGDKVALSAWNEGPYTSATVKPGAGKGVLAECTHFSKKAFDLFRDTNRGKGPERFPVDQLTPGT